MDAKTRLSVGVLCHDVLLASSICAPNVGWLTPYLTRNAVRGYYASNENELTDLLTSIGSTLNLSLLYVTKKDQKS